MISDDTPPDQPEIWVTSMTGKNVIEIDKPTRMLAVKSAMISLT